MTIVKDKVKSVIDALKSLTKLDVLVGIPESTTARDDGDIGNAQIGYINEKGSPVNNLPARPFSSRGSGSGAEIQAATCQGGDLGA